MRFALVTFALALFSSPLYAADMPSRKPGLWEVKMHASGMPQPMTSQQCIDEKTDNLMQQRGQDQARQQCSKNTVRHEANRVIVESVCKLGQTTAITKAVFSGDFKSNYRGEINSTYTPPMHGVAASKQTLETKWLGACKPGQKPGDVIMQGMGSININELMKNMPKN